MSKKHTLLLVILIATFVAPGFAETTPKVDEIAKLTFPMLRILQADQEELSQLQAGKVGLNGHTISGKDFPQALSTGNDEVDQIYSAPARVRVLQKEIVVCKRTLLLIRASVAGTYNNGYVTTLSKLDSPALDKELLVLSALPKAPNTVFLLSVFQCVLHRQPDPQSMERLDRLLASGTGRPVALRAILKMSQAPSPTEFVRDSFRAVLGRKPHQTEIEKWIKIVQQLGVKQRYKIVDLLLGSSLTNTGGGGVDKINETPDKDIIVGAAVPPPPASTTWGSLSAGSAGSIISQALLLDSIPPTSQNQKTTFSLGDMIYIWVESRVLNKPHKLEIVWMDPSGKEVKRETFDLHGWGARETVWSELQTGRQMTQGRWRIDFLVDGRIDRTMSLILKP